MEIIDCTNHVQLDEKKFIRRADAVHICYHGGGDIKGGFCLIYCKDGQALTIKSKYVPEARRLGIPVKVSAACKACR